MKNRNPFYIDRNIKRSQLPKIVLEQLEPYSLLNIKFSIGVFTFFLIDFLFLIPMVTPSISAFLFGSIPLVIILNIWAIALMFRKAEETEVEAVLFLFCCGLGGSICFLLLALKYAFMSGIISPVYYIIMVLLFLSTIYLFFYNQIRKYKNLEETKKKETPKWHFYILSIAVPSGYIFAQFLLGLSDSIVSIVMIIVFLVFSIFFVFLMTKSLHKYLLMRYNPHLVKLSKKKLKKNKIAGA